jgi:hypothetical protein
MVLYDVVAIDKITTLDPMADYSQFITLSVNFGSQQQPDIKEKYFRYDRDNIRLPAMGGGTIPGEWWFSWCPHRPTKVDPWLLWKYVVKHVPEGQRYLALKVKRRDDVLDNRGDPRWELVYIRSAKRSDQSKPTSKRTSTAGSTTTSGTNNLKRMETPRFHWLRKRG